jgi:hypothetical protein
LRALSTLLLSRSALRLNFIEIASTLVSALSFNCSAKFLGSAARPSEDRFHQSLLRFLSTEP